MCGDISSEIQTHFVEQIKTLSEHLKGIVGKLESEFEIIKSKGYKEVKTIEKKLNSLMKDLKIVQINQDILSNKIDKFNHVSCPCLKSKTTSNEIIIPEGSSQPKKSPQVVPHEQLFEEKFLLIIHLN